MEAESSYFFATRADLEPGLRAAERQHSLQYVLTGSFDTPTLQRFRSGLELPDLGCARHGDTIGEARYLVLNSQERVRVRAVPQRRGGMRYLVDASGNPSAVLFRPAGLYKERCLISGEIVGVGDPRSLRFYHFFAPVVLAGFERIHEFLVGPEAARLLDEGWRLTQRERAPAECDLERPFN